MKIGLDGRALHGVKTGIGRYVYELCCELDKSLPEAEFYVYSSVPIKLPIESNRWNLRLDNSFISKYLKPVLWLKLRCGMLCTKDNLDLFWGTATFLPKLKSNVIKIITIYDLNFKIAPETMSFTHLWAFRLFFKHDVKRADIIFSISEGGRFNS